MGDKEIQRTGERGGGDTDRGDRGHEDGWRGDLYEEEARPLHPETLPPVAQYGVLAYRRGTDDGCPAGPHLFHDSLGEEDVAHRRVLHEEPVLDHLADHLRVGHAAGEEEREDERAVVMRGRELVEPLEHLVDAVDDLGDT